MYYCNLCIVNNIPFSSVSILNLNTLNNSDGQGLHPNVSEPNIQTVSTVASCNFCMECNPECCICPDNICIDPYRICDTCLICSYVLDKNEFKKVYEDYTSKFQNFVSAIHFNARSLSKNFKSISKLIDENEINFDLIAMTEIKLIKKGNPLLSR